MNKCIVVHVREPHDVYGGRPGWLGNPFFMRSEAEREEACDRFEALRAKDEAFKERVRRELKGKRIACHCKPRRCHLDWIAKVANGDVA